jgi:hypothetical protein
MLCEPELRDDVVKLATPFFKFPVPNAVFPSMNVTFPVDVVVGDVTVAVNFTFCFTLEGFGAEVSAVDEVALFTTCLSADDLLPACPASPP